MKLKQTRRGTSTIISIHGSLVNEELSKLNDAIEESLRSGTPNIVLELSEVPYIDSAGLELLLDLVSRLGKLGGDIRLAALNEVCLEIFSATRMDNFYNPFGDADSALRSMA